uniref:Abhydrolase_3 domain-containing protein n=1 Tax=Macrostomum lignano TaxID=282301 RepID=A0A1I8FB19_9PLAT
KLQRRPQFRVSFRPQPGPSIRQAAYPPPWTADFHQALTMAATDEELTNNLATARSAELRGFKENSTPPMPTIWPTRMSDAGLAAHSCCCQNVGNSWSCQSAERRPPGGPATGQSTGRQTRPPEPIAGPSGSLNFIVGQKDVCLSFIMDSSGRQSPVSKDSPATAARLCSQSSFRCQRCCVRLNLDATLRGLDREAVQATINTFSKSIGLLWLTQNRVATRSSKQQQQQPATVAQQCLPAATQSPQRELEPAWPPCAANPGAPDTGRHRRTKPVGSNNDLGGVADPPTTRHRTTTGTIRGGELARLEQRRLSYARRASSPPEAELAEVASRSRRRGPKKSALTAEQQHSCSTPYSELKAAAVSCWMRKLSATRNHQGNVNTSVTRGGVSHWYDAHIASIGGFRMAGRVDRSTGRAECRLGPVRAWLLQAVSHRLGFASTVYTIAAALFEPRPLVLRLGIRLGMSAYLSCVTELLAFVRDRYGKDRLAPYPLHPPKEIEDSARDSQLFGLEIRTNAWMSTEPELLQKKRQTFWIGFDSAMR